MKNIHEMSSAEILEKLARFTELTPVFEEKKNKLTIENNKKLEHFVYNKMAEFLRNVTNEDFNMVKFTDELIKEYGKILSETNVYTDEEMEIIIFVTQLTLYSKIKK
jgi:K+/H+ antiporter YhaU regulatory subunit KhtT